MRKKIVIDSKVVPGAAVAQVKVAEHHPFVLCAKSDSRGLFVQRIQPFPYCFAVHDHRARTHYIRLETLGISISGSGIHRGSDHLFLVPAALCRKATSCRQTVRRSERFPLAAAGDRRFPLVCPRCPESEPCFPLASVLLEYGVDAEVPVALVFLGPVDLRLHLNPVIASVRV